MARQDDSTVPEEPRVIPRLPSGIAHLDEVLGGGWLAGGLYAIVGPPGTGKSTLANQMCFAAARRGESAVYVTLLTEAHERMLLHLRPMAFFEPELVGTRITYVSGIEALDRGGDALLEMVSRALAEHRPSVLVIDGYTITDDQFESTHDARRFVQQLATRAALHGCTVFLLATEESKGIGVKHALADGIVALSADLIGLKATRGLEVIKFRGSASLPGRHTFRITREGVLVYPRFESVHTRPSPHHPDADRRSCWGVEGLDAMCFGGLVTLSSTLLMGSPGSGKTLLGLSFLAEGARRGEPGLYYGFAENVPHLVRKSRSVSLHLQPLLDDGSLYIESRAPVETLPDAVAQELLGMVERLGIRRVVLDGLEPFAKEAIDPERTTRFLSALVSSLRDQGVTAIFTQQTNDLFGPELHAPIKGSEAICDNVVFLRFFELGGSLQRLITVLKMRDSDNDPRLRELLIREDGVRVGETYASLSALLTGQPRVWPSAGAGAQAARKVRSGSEKRRRSSGGKTGTKSGARKPGRRA